MRGRKRKTGKVDIVIKLRDGEPPVIRVIRHDDYSPKDTSAWDRSGGVTAKQITVWVEKALEQVGGADAED